MSIVLNIITCVMVILSFVMFLRGEKRIIRRINESEDMVYKFLCLRPCDKDLAHVADIEDADIVAYGVVFLDNPGILDRHVESGEGTHQRAQFYMIVM